MKNCFRFISIILSLILILSVSGCAETPDKDIVVNKGDGTLEDKIENSTGNGLDIDIDTSDNNEEHDLVSSFTSSGGDVTFNINADVSYPDVNTFPVLKAVPHFFTSEELEHISNVLCKGNPIYEYSEVLTKSELEAEILKCKQFISDDDYLMEYYYGDEDVINRVVQDYEQRIANMEAAYADAPDVEPKIESDFKYHDDSYYATSYSLIGGLDGIESFKATSDIDGMPIYISASKRNDDSYILSNIIAYIYDYRSYWNITDDKINESDFYQTTLFDDDDIANAIPLIESTLSDMGLSDWGIRSFDVLDYHARFYCTPEYYDIAMSADQNYGTLKGDFDYNTSYAYPNLEIVVSNNQIIDVWFEGPLDVTEVLNENVELLSYSEALKRIYEQLEITWTKNKVCEWVINDPRYSPISGEVNVSYIELCLARVNIKNDPDSYYIIPTWMVYGTASLTEYTVMGETATSTKSRSEEVPLLAVNAIDGSVIDMSQGY